MTDALRAADLEDQVEMLREEIAALKAEMVYWQEMYEGLQASLVQAEEQRCSVSLDYGGESARCRRAEKAQAALAKAEQDRDNWKKSAEGYAYALAKAEQERDEFEEAHDAAVSALGQAEARVHSLNFDAKAWIENCRKAQQEIVALRTDLFESRRANAFDVECLNAGYAPSWVRRLIEDRAALQLRVEKAEHDRDEARSEQEHLEDTVIALKAQVQRVRELCAGPSTSLNFAYVRAILDNPEPTPPPRRCAEGVEYYDPRDAEPTDDQRRRPDGRVAFANECSSCVAANRRCHCG